MTNNLFIDYDYIIENSVVPGNIDSKFLSGFITKSQEINIRDIIGSDMYNRIDAGITATNAGSGDVLTALEITLLEDYIQPALLNWTVFTALPFIHYRILNIGIAKKDSEHSDPISKDELNAFRNNVKDLAEYYSERLKDYLLENYNLYPEYNNPSSGIDTILPDMSSQYQSSMYLPSQRRRTVDKPGWRNDCR